MNTWNCCRTCLDVQFLNPIFSAPEYSEKYSAVILNATGIKVELNDPLPQQMCSTCINFINNSYKFRKKCDENQKILFSRIKAKQMYEIKVESNIFKSENSHAIDISDLVNDFNSFNDNENSIHDFIDSVENNDNQDIEFETAAEEIVEKPADTIYKEKQSKRNVKPTRRSLRSKKESGEKKARVKEEIECEYCHKILTSKLSLRNHYKIHTGFDVVCECPICNKREKSKKRLQVHKYKVHREHRYRYLCPVCQESFTRPGNVRKHLRRVHEVPRDNQGIVLKYLCPRCPKTYKCPDHVRRHLVNFHNLARSEQGPVEKYVANS